MSRQPELVLATTSPQAVEWYEKIRALRAEEHKLRMAYEAKMLEEFGVPDKARYEYDDKPDRRALWVRGDIAYALDSGYSERPPEDSGWRLDSKDRNWQPKLATLRGKERREELRALNLVHMRTRWQEVGIPQMFWGEGYIYYPTISYDEDSKTIYILWGTQYAEPDFMKGTAEFPEIEWRRVPLSEWHAYVEKREAEKKSDDE